MDLSQVIKRGPAIAGTITTVPKKNRLAFIQILLPPLMIMAGYYLGGMWNWLWLIATPIGPVMDYRGGRDQRNPAKKY